MLPTAGIVDVGFRYTSNFTSSLSPTTFDEEVNFTELLLKVPGLYCM